MKNLSVVISAYNEEQNLEECLKSVKIIAGEVIVVDNSSTDRTNEIAKKYTDKVFIRENNLMLNVNKNFGFSKASGEWILNLDADERVTEELASEIKKLLSEKPSYNGYTMPRKNIIFGKWIKHAGWYPDRQLRLFRKGKGKFEEKHVHEMIKVEGEVGELNGSIYHLNYKNLSQFLDKMIRVYTSNEAENLINSGYKFDMRDVVSKPTGEFVKRFFAEKGYLDGSHGFALSCLMAFYHLVVLLRVWEKNSYPESNALKEFENGGKQSLRDIRYWLNRTKNENEKNPLVKTYRRVLQKISR